MLVVIVVLVLVMAGSVVPVPIVIFVICDAGCISYCHYLMMVVACTAGLIANCDSCLVHCVCMQGCMFREITFDMGWSLSSSSSENEEQYCLIVNRHFLPARLRMRNSIVLEKSAEEKRVKPF